MLFIIQKDWTILMWNTSIMMHATPPSSYDKNHPAHTPLLWSQTFLWTKDGWSLGLRRGRSSGLDTAHPLQEVPVWPLTGKLGNWDPTCLVWQPKTKRLRMITEWISSGIQTTGWSSTVLAWPKKPSQRSWW